MSLKLFGTSEPVEQAALKQQMIDMRLPVGELRKSEAERKKQQKEREKRQKEAQKGIAGRKGNGMQFEGGSGQFANITIPGDLPTEPSMDDIMMSSKTFNPREMGEVVNKFGSGEETLSQLRMAQQPSALATTLLPYQRQGLAWMLDKESPTLPPSPQDVVQLWKRSTNGMSINMATSFTVKTPQLASGGILADDMVGKIGAVFAHMP